MFSLQHIIRAKMIHSQQLFRRFIYLSLACVLLSSCTPATPSVSPVQVKQTRQADKKTQVAILTSQPNLAPDQPGNMSAPALPVNGSLQVTVTDPDSKELHVETYLRKKTAETTPFTIIALPDTQFYAMDYPETGLAQTRWIMENKDKLNIVAVAHLGDSVHMAEDLRQWQNADSFMQILGSDLPFGLSVGNHDQYPLDDPEGDSTKSFNTYFGVDEFAGRPYYGGHYGMNNDNSYILFDVGEIKFVMLFLESDDNPNSEVLDWAKDVLNQNSDRLGILVVHSLLYADGRWTTEGYPIFQHLKNASNLRLMLGGHIPGEARRTDTVDGVTIHSILSDYQEDEMGGNGMLRILTFDPAANKLSVQTYSPTVDQYLADDANQFTLDFDLNQPFVSLSQQTITTAEDPISIPYTGLDQNADYEWYVRVSDGVSVVHGPIWEFSTR